MLTSAALVFVCATALSLRAQQNKPQTDSVGEAIGRAFGNAVVNGTPSQSGATVFVNDTVDVPPAGHMSLVRTGSSLVFTPGARFEAMHNAYRLESGGSGVATYSGMTAHLPNCYSVTPVRLDTLTQYEVDWSGSAAYVYARKQDVRINYWTSGEPDPAKDRNNREPDHGWIVKQGHWARINDVKLCKPAVYLWPEPNLPTAAGLTAATGFFVSIPFWDMSPDHP